MKRIRYVRSDAGDQFLESEKLNTNKEPIKVILNTSILEYTVVGVNTIDVLERGTAVSIQMLKKRAKEAAKSHGVVFEDEMRPRVKLNEGN